MSTTWNLDPTHSEITFKVRHMMIPNVKGNFNNFNATLEADDESFNKVKVHTVIKTDSV